MPRTITVAAAQYNLDEFSDLAAYRDKITRWVENAVAKGAELLVFPEYGDGALQHWCERYGFGNQQAGCFRLL